MVPLNLCVRRVQRYVCVKLPKRFQSTENAGVYVVYVQSHLNTVQYSAHRHFQLKTSVQVTLHTHISVHDENTKD